MKIESSTSFTLTPTSACTITLVLDQSNKSIKINEIKEKTNAQSCLVINASQGAEYVVKKGDSMNLYAIAFEPVATGIQDVQAVKFNTVKTAKVLKDGKLVIMHGGKQYNVAGVLVK